MLFLLLHIILISGFGLILKYARNRGHRMNPIGFVNYFTAFLVSIWSVTRTGDFAFTKMTFALGSINGITYATGFSLVTLGMRLSGIVVTIAVVRLSLLIPVIFAIVVWSEIPTIWQAVGIILACCALPLLGTKTPDSTNPKKNKPRIAGFRSTQLATCSTKENKLAACSTPEEKSFVPAFGKDGAGLGLLVVAFLFFNSGISRLAMKAFNEMCPIEQKPIYLFFLFGITALAFAGVCIYQKTAPTRWEIFYGVLIGFCNIGGSWGFLKALDSVDALVAFPVSGSGGVLFTMLVGILLLGERLGRRSMVGVLATVLALIFVNLKGG